MNLLPLHTETLVSPLSKKEVLGHLMRVTREVNYLDVRTEGGPEIKFNGMVGQEGFRIFRAIKRGETFLPLITGDVEATPRGSIIFLKYRLFPSAVFFLVFWSVVLVLFAAYYFFGVENYDYGTVCVCLGIFNYFLGIYFFQRQVKLSKDIFHELINFQMKDKD